MPSPANTASKLEAYFESRSLIRNRKLPLPVRSKDRFLPCWASQAESGFLVAPAMWTRLVWSSITKNTYRVLSQMDSTVNKSVARIPCAWIAEELPPGRLRPPPSRTEPASAQERADRRRRDPDPELDQLAPNPHAPLSRVLPAHPKDQLPNVSRRVAASRRWRSDGRSTSCGRARGASAGASAGSLRTKTNPGEGEPG
jgi:hypothetical protein